MSNVLEAISSSKTAKITFLVL